MCGLAMHVYALLWLAGGESRVAKFNYGVGDLLAFIEFDGGRWPSTILFAPLN